MAKTKTTTKKKAKPVSLAVSKKKTGSTIKAKSVKPKSTKIKKTAGKPVKRVTPAKRSASNRQIIKPTEEQIKRLIDKGRLRGFVTQDKNDAVALLEVAGVRTFLVREGDEVNIDPSQPNSAIRITKITRLSVTVETGTLGSIRVQR